MRRLRTGRLRARRLPRERPDVASLSGAELVADADWFGLRSHPSPAGTLSFGGPAIPGWLDDALRDMVTGGA